MAAGCSSRPLHHGPDVARVPEGFVFDPGFEAPGLFATRPPVLQRGYVTAAIADDDHSDIGITQYDGAATGEQVAAAITAERERRGDTEYGTIESLTIDRKPAWGWTETRRHTNGAIRVMAYRAVVSYGHASYLVEFYTSHARFMDASKLRAVVTSFVVSD
jgi:hypothetical protein